MSIKDFSNILGADLAKKVYDDTLSPAAQQVGKTLEDVIKGLRLFYVYSALNKFESCI